MSVDNGTSCSEPPLLISVLLKDTVGRFLHRKPVEDLGARQPGGAPSPGCEGYCHPALTAQGAPAQAFLRNSSVAFMLLALCSSSAVLVSSRSETKTKVQNTYRLFPTSQYFNNNNSNSDKVLTG